LDPLIREDVMMLNKKAKNARKKSNRKRFGKTV